MFNPKYFVFVLLLCSFTRAHALTWTSISLGVSKAEFSEGVVIKVDPKLANLVLLNKSELGFTKPIEAFAIANNLVVATNASMFAPDELTSVGYMRNVKSVNNPHHNPKFSGFLAFNPNVKSFPPVKIIEKSNSKWRDEIKQYDTVIETFRMISRAGKNMWKPGNARYYESISVGLDKSGNVLIFSYPAFQDMHALNEMIRKLKLNLDGLLYIEGDSKGSLYISGEGVEGFAGILPNVLGVQLNKPTAN